MFDVACNNKEVSDKELDHNNGAYDSNQVCLSITPSLFLSEGLSPYSPHSLSNKSRDSTSLEVVGDVKSLVFE